MPDIRPISNTLAAIARDELFEVPERIVADIETIRTWLEIQPHLKSRMDDQFIIMFLRGCKYSLERVKVKLEMFYTVRNIYPEFFQNRDPQLEMNLRLIRSGFIVPLPMTNGDNGPRISLVRPGIIDENNVLVEDVIKVATIFHEILLMEDDQLVIAGEIGIVDFSNITMALLSQCHPTMLKKMALSFQEFGPLRQKGYHYIHTPSAFDALFNILKGFLNEKLKNRIFFHGHNMESLFKHVPKKLLPLEYGGNAGPIQKLIDEWEKKIICHSELFRNEEQYGCDECKRIGGRNDEGKQFGVDGSFRKLDID